MESSPMQELLVEQLRDLYDAEKQLTKALPKLAKSAHDQELTQGFRDHLEQTRGQAQRLEQIFETMGMKAKSKPCAAMKGLVQEGHEAIEEELEAPAGDLALIAAARRMEHYEIAAYDALVNVSQAIKQKEVTTRLQETLQEEVAADKLLASIAKRLAKEAGKAKPAVEEAEDAVPAGKKAASKETSSKKAGKAVAKPGGDHSSQTTVDHAEIRRWAEERGGQPACVQGTGAKGDVGLIRLEFPNAPNAKDGKLDPISWEEFFEKFDEHGLALVYQEHTAAGVPSNFNKLVTRESSVSGK